MKIRKYTLDNGHCTEGPGGLYGLWEINTPEKKGSTKYAVYVSGKKYNELVKILKARLKELSSPLTKEFVMDFIEDALEEKLGVTGGVVAYFLPRIGNSYSLRPTGLVRKIDIVEEKES